jgi:hypothetical protein
MKDNQSHQSAACNVWRAAAIVSMCAAGAAMIIGLSRLGVLVNWRPLAHRRQRLFERWAHETRQRAPMMTRM